MFARSRTPSRTPSPCPFCASDKCKAPGHPRHQIYSPCICIWPRQIMNRALACGQILSASQVGLVGAGPRACPRQVETWPGNEMMNRGQFVGAGAPRLSGRIIPTTDSAGALACVSEAPGLQPLREPRPSDQGLPQAKAPIVRRDALVPINPDVSGLLYQKPHQDPVLETSA